MFAIIGTICFTIVIVMTIMLGCGCPLGEFTMGGQPPVLPKKMRLLVWTMLPIQIFGAIILLQNGSLIPLFFSANVVRGIGIGYAIYFTLNTIMNGISKSKKERFLMTPLSLITAICFYITCFMK